MREHLPTVDSPYFNMQEAALYLKYTSKHAPSVVRVQLRRAGVPMYRRNRKSWLVRRVDLDEWVITGKAIEAQRFWVESQRRSKHTAKVTYRPPPDMGKRRPGRPRKYEPAPDVGDE